MLIAFHSPLYHLFLGSLTFTAIIQLKIKFYYVNSI